MKRISCIVAVIASFFLRLMSESSSISGTKADIPNGRLPQTSLATCDSCVVIWKMTLQRALRKSESVSTLNVAGA